METTRRGFFGLVAGAAATAAGVKPEPRVRNISYFTRPTADELAAEVRAIQAACIDSKLTALEVQAKLLGRAASRQMDYMALAAYKDARG